MIFKKGDIAQFVLEDENPHSFKFLLIRRDTPNSEDTVHCYEGETKLLVSRDAHRFNLISGSTPLITMELHPEYRDEYYPNRPASQYWSYDEN